MEKRRKWTVFSNAEFLIEDNKSSTPLFFHPSMILSVIIVQNVTIKSSANAARANSDSSIYIFMIRR